MNANDILRIGQVLSNPNEYEAWEVDICERRLRYALFAINRYEELREVFSKNSDEPLEEDEDFEIDYLQSLFDALEYCDRVRMKPSIIVNIIRKMITFEKVGLELQKVVNPDVIKQIEILDVLDKKIEERFKEEK